MDTVDLGRFLLLEGALVTGLFLARALCVRSFSMDTVPVALRPRIDRVNRLAPMIVVLGFLAMGLGGVLCVVGS